MAVCAVRVCWVGRGGLSCQSVTPGGADLPLLSLAVAADLLRTRREKTTPATISAAATAAPTAMPTMAPVERALAASPLLAALDGAEETPVTAKPEAGILAAAAMAPNTGCSAGGKVVVTVARFALTAATADAEEPAGATTRAYQVTLLVTCSARRRLSGEVLAVTHEAGQPSTKATCAVTFARTLAAPAAPAACCGTAATMVMRLRSDAVATEAAARVAEADGEAATEVDADAAAAEAEADGVAPRLSDGVGVPVLTAVPVAVPEAVGQPALFSVSEKPACT